MIASDIDRKLLSPLTQVPLAQTRHSFTSAPLFTRVSRFGSELDSIHLGLSRN